MEKYLKKKLFRIIINKSGGIPSNQYMLIKTNYKMKNDALIPY